MKKIYLFMSLSLMMISSYAAQVECTVFQDGRSLATFTETSNPGPFLISIFVGVDGTVIEDFDTSTLFPGFATESEINNTREEMAGSRIITLAKNLEASFFQLGSAKITPPGVSRLLRPDATTLADLSSKRFGLLNHEGLSILCRQ